MCSTEIAECFEFISHHIERKTLSVIKSLGFLRTHKIGHNPQRDSEGDGSHRPQKKPDRKQPHQSVQCRTSANPERQPDR